MTIEEDLRQLAEQLTSLDDEGPRRAANT